MQKIEPIEYGRYYHIYNRGINGTDLFITDDNYSWFFELYNKYVDLIADTYAWCLMKNHFHFLVRIKDEEDIQPFEPLSGLKTTERVTDLKTPSAVSNPDGGLVKPLFEPLSGFKTAERVIGLVKGKERKPKPSNQFSHLFNSYAQAFNKTINRYGYLRRYYKVNGYKIIFIGIFI